MQADEALSDFECTVPANVLDKYNYKQTIVKIAKGDTYEFLKIVGFNASDDFKISPKFFSIFRGGFVEYLDSQAFAPPGKLTLLTNFYPTEKNLDEISYFLKDFCVIRLGQKMIMSSDDKKTKEIKVIALFDTKMNKITNSQTSISGEILFDYIIKFKEFSFDSDISII